MHFLLLILLLFDTTTIRADIIKPALIEINTYSSGNVEIEIRASIEAILTGINSDYKNTNLAPQADQYDKLRQLPPKHLLAQFKAYEAQFLKSIQLKAGKTATSLDVDSVSIPEVGYNQVPRISTIVLKGQITSGTHSLQWFYPAKYSDYAVRLKQINLITQQWHWSDWQWIRNNQASQPFTLSISQAPTSIFNTIKNFIAIGFTHILPKGLDHILFIFGLFLLSKRWRPLFWQVTAFTVAHSITLALATIGIVQISAEIVEPLIALSIVAVGLDNIFRSQLSTHRILLVFVFGLLHGLGFASVLSEFDLSTTGLMISLLSFNIGVEAAQLFLLLCTWLCIGWWIKEPTYRNVVIIPCSSVLSLVAFIWFIQRI